MAADPQCRSWHCAAVAAPDGNRFGLYTYRPGQHHPRHAHPHTAVSMVLAGRVDEAVGASSVRAPAHHVVIKPRGTYHENRFEVDHPAVLVQVILPDETVREALDAGCPLDRWSWKPAGPAAPVFVRLARLLADDAAPETLRRHLDDVLGTLDLEPTPTRPAPLWLRRARRRLREAVRDGDTPPSVASLARDAGVHRVHFTREFRRHFGVSPTEYRIRQRVSAAADRVGGADEALARVAYGVGYADQAHMTREFADRLGATPLEYRRLSTHGRPG